MRGNGKKGNVFTSQTADRYIKRLREKFGTKEKETIKWKDLLKEKTKSNGEGEPLHDVFVSLEKADYRPAIVRIDDPKLTETRRRGLSQSTPFNWLNKDFYGAAIHASYAIYTFGDNLKEIPLHRQAGVEISLVLKGRVTFVCLDLEIDDDDKPKFYFKEVEVRENQFVYVPPGLPHGVKWI